MAREQRGITVTVRGWDKFNGRKDVTHPSWFRVEYRLLEDPDFFDFSHEEFKVWFYVLAQCCRKACDTVFLNFAHARTTAKLSQQGILGALKKLEELQLVLVNVTDAERERNADDTRQDRTGQNRTGQDETDTATSAASELFSESTQDILEKVSRDVQDAWLQTYPDAGWIRQELAKAWAWCKANPKKAPRSDWARFVNGWLSRGWEQHRKSIPSNRAEARSQGNQNTLQEYLSRIGGANG